MSYFRGGAAALHAGKKIYWFIFFLYLFLLSALTTPHPLAGVLALSAWLPLSSTFPKVR